MDDNEITQEETQLKDNATQTVSKEDSDVAKVQDILDNLENTANVSFVVMFKKEKYNITFPLDATMRSLKHHVETLSAVKACHQKIMFRGMTHDDKTLRELKIIEKSKLMLIGSTSEEITTVQNQKQTEPTAKVVNPKVVDPASIAALHKKVLSSGKPANIMPGLVDLQLELPEAPLVGILNQRGDKVRLAFKTNELKISSSSSTRSIKTSDIMSMDRGDIEGHPEYAILGLQVKGFQPSWFYWIPVQYWDSIVKTIPSKK